MIKGTKNTTLIYVHDPMCSWCFGFSKAYNTIVKELAGRVDLVRLLGGLATDTDEPMHLEMQSKLQQTWRQIEQVIPGTKFNYDFWKNCKPRRATYPACRAVIAARLQGEEFDVLITEAIQEAYYLKAKNPSDLDVLINLADELGLDAKKFEHDLKSTAVQLQLTEDIRLSRSIGISSYPSMAVIANQKINHIDLAYTDPVSMLKQINAAVKPTV
ncbi:MAG: DsbA family protein [Pseudomonadales bacterium]